MFCSRPLVSWRGLSPSPGRAVYHGVVERAIKRDIMPVSPIRRTNQRPSAQRPLPVQHKGSSPLSPVQEGLIADIMGHLLQLQSRVVGLSLRGLGGTGSVVGGQHHTFV
ncbi:hypothetical protein RRG08_001652 [Elysia crispata]|uniref:Uncharacterized protein n=1 Tax=Elysia crispata TaxID=231223 RepID=A0AAE1AK81_9GAST|nr:hypothetical protein RRG08_001652 [Elysia crispata]